MFTVRIHGFGGQDVLAAAELLSVAAYTDGRHGQAFRVGGQERTGSPTVACCRIDDRPLPAREPVLTPDAVVVRDPALLGVHEVFDGLGPDGYVLIDATGAAGRFGLAAAAGRRPERTVAVPASEIARRELGLALPNAALLGGLAALTGVVSLASVETAIRESFGGRLAHDNVEAARDAFAFVRYQQRERLGAAAAEAPAPAPAEVPAP